MKTLLLQLSFINLIDFSSVISTIQSVIFIMLLLVVYYICANGFSKRKKMIRLGFRIGFFH